MNRAQADRSVIARRAGATRSTTRTSRTSRTGRPGTDLRARTSTPVYATGPIRRSRAVKMTATQKNSDTGRASEWNRSAYYFTDPKWSQTMGNRR